MGTIHLSQSAITRQLESLEHSLKTKLLKDIPKELLLLNKELIYLKKLKNFC